jgi:NTE family protein
MTLALMGEPAAPLRVAAAGRPALQLVPSPTDSFPPGEARDRLSKTAWVLEGGASHGAAQAGAILALFEAGFEPDILLGSSVGALNAAFLAGFDRGGAIELTDVWRHLRRRDVLTVNPYMLIGGLLGVHPFVVSNRPLARLITRHIHYARIELAARPLVVTATDARTGEPVELTTGPIHSALLASAAMPAVFAPVARDGRLLIDGTISNDTPISAAIAAGATDVIVLPTASALSDQTPRHPLHMIQQAFDFATDQHARTQRRASPNDVAVWVAPTPLTKVNQLDFGHAEALIELGHDRAAAWVRTLPHALRVPRPRRLSNRSQRHV